MNGILSTTTLVAALASGLVAGVFFAFSSFVMRSLHRLEPAHGIAAMQSINQQVAPSWFIAALIGTGVLCGGLGVSSLFRIHEPAAVYRLVAAVLYLVGVVALTGLYHVPRNDLLAALDPVGSGAADDWARYVEEWTRWNHLRTLAPLASATLFTIAYRVG